MLLQITHKTQYSYDQPVDYALQKIRLRPVDGPLQRVTSWDLLLDGGKIEADYNDHYGNITDLVSLETGAQKLVITATGTVETTDNAGVLGMVYGRAPLWHFEQETPLTQLNNAVAALAGHIGTTANPLQELHALSAAVLAATPYQTGQTHAQTTASEALAMGCGVCQDHAHIFITAARSKGIPARYVSGYLLLNDTIDQDASHAWAEVHLDGLGWVGFDISNGVAPDGKYVRIAIGRDSKDAAPISGLRMGDASEALIVSLQVQQ